MFSSKIVFALVSTAVLLLLFVFGGILQPTWVQLTSRDGGLNLDGLRADLRVAAGVAVLNAFNVSAGGPEDSGTTTLEGELIKLEQAVDRHAKVLENQLERLHALSSSGPSKVSEGSATNGQTSGQAEEEAGYHQLLPAPVDCEMIRESKAEPRLSWQPQEEKYLLVTCARGTLFDRLQCIRNHIVAATLLQRSLVLPLSSHDSKREALGVDMQLGVDSQHMRKCFGEQAVQTLEQYTGKSGGPLVVQRVLCWEPNCGLVGGLVDTGPAELSAVWPVPSIKYSGPVGISNLGLNATLADFNEAYGSLSENVLMIGGLLNSQLVDQLDLYKVWPLPISRDCRVTLQPHAAIVSTAENFVKAYMGHNFLAVRVDGQSTGLPLSRILAQVDAQLSKMEDGATIFLSADEETNVYDDFTNHFKSQRQVVKLPSQVFTAHHGWGWDMVTSHLASDGRMNRPMHAAMEAVVCALARAFLGSSQSTYSRHVQTMRFELGVATCDDAILGDS